MIVTHKISMDLAHPHMTCIEAMQDDCYSRDLQIRLTANDIPFLPPEGCAVEIGFSKSDGRCGRYDTMPDGTPAWRLSGDLLTVRLAPQVLTVAGEVSVLVTLGYGTHALSCFPIRLLVQKRPNFNGISEDYVHITRFLPQPEQAQVGMCLLVEAVDEQGRVTAVGCGEAPAGGSGGVGGYYTPSMQVSDGNLVITYLPSHDQMPALSTQTLPLPSGQTGASGVYLGTKEPTDDAVMVWIDPEGGPSGANPVERSGQMTLDVGMDADGRLYVDAYSKASVDAALGSYISDVDALIGGEG